MNFKRIFITIPWFVPAFRAGGPVQSVANLVHEFREGVEYFIFCGDVDLNGAELEGIHTNEWVTYHQGAQVWYATPDKISDTLVKQVELLKPDIIFIIGMFSWHFNIVPMMFCKGPQKILSTRGMLHPGALSQKKWKKKVYLQLFKLLEYQYKVDFHATDEEEAEYIRKYFDEPPKVFVAGNFPNKMELLVLPDKEPGKLKMVTVGIISEMKNVLLVLEALQQVTSDVEYHLYGPLKSEDYWDLCKQQIKQLPENIKVEYHKEIEPERVKEVLLANHIFVLPSRSENFGHAIYEALSAGRPVITSHHTRWNDLQQSKAGMNVSSDFTIELMDAIHFFAQMSFDELQEWSKGAFEYAERAVDLEVVREGYRRMFLIS